MQKRSNVVVNRVGKVISGAEVTVKTLGGSTATIYSSDGGSPTTNPVPTDSYGHYSYYAADGRYTEEVRKDGVLLATETDILLEDPADGSEALAATTGAGLVGFSYALTYAAGTIGKWLKDLATSAGSELVGFVANSADAVLRTVRNKLREQNSVYDFGVVGDATTDDTTAAQKALNHGGSILLPDTCRMLINGTLTIKKGVRLHGAISHYAVDPAVGDYYALGSQIRLGPSGKIVLERGAGLERALVIRAGLYVTPPTNAIQAAAVLAAFAGTAIEATSATDAYINDCMILGHANAIVASSSDRIDINDVRIDAQSGVSISNSFDINRLHKIHCWPFLTAMVPGVGNTPNNPAPNRRTGHGFKLDTYCDWSTLVDCFAYGYAKPFWAHDTSNVGFVRCQADYTNPNTGSVAAFTIDGTSTYTTLDGCTAIAAVRGVLVDTTGGGAADSGVKITSTTFATTGECIHVENGNIAASTCTFHSGTYGASFAAGADASSVNNCLFDGVTTDFYFASTAIQRLVSRIGNTWQGTAPSATPERVMHTMTVQKSGNVFSLLDTAAVAGGAGATYKTEQEFAAGTQDAMAIKASLVSGTAGNEAVAMQFGVNRNGSIQWRVQLHHDGHWVPITDNAVDMGQSSARWRNAYAVTYRVGNGNAFWQSGNGSPEGVVTAAIGSIYSRLDGGAGTSFYVKESGVGNTGWVAK